MRLRVWFNDGTNGSQLLTPDQRIAAVGYAMIAGNVPDGAITSAKIASGAVGNAQLATGITITGNLTGNASTANGLKTTGADVAVSSGNPPTAGQVLAATSSTSATWQSLPTPKFDRQFAVGNSTSTTSTSYVDIPGATLTTHDLGQSGTYMITFRTSATQTQTRAVSVILNINGSDIAASEVTVTPSGGSPTATASIQYVAASLSSGSVIKVRFKEAGAGTASCASTQLTIDGVPDSYVQ